MEGLKNFLQLIYDNWTTIMVIIGLLIGLYQKIKSYLKLSNEEKVEIAWTQIKQTILSMVSDAELNYPQWKKAGEAKRSEVIKRIFDDYPILLTVTDQQSVIKQIDKLLYESLDKMREIIEQNQSLIETDVEKSEEGE